MKKSNFGSSGKRLWTRRQTGYRSINGLNSSCRTVGGRKSEKQEIEVAKTAVGEEERKRKRFRSSRERERERERVPEAKPPHSLNGKI